MIMFFLAWLEKCCSIKKNRVKLRVGLNESCKEKVATIEAYWSQITNIPLTQFQKPFFQKAQWSKKYEHPEEYHGVLRIRITKSIDLLREIHGWITGLGAINLN